MPTCVKRSELGLRGPRNGPQNWPPELPRGASCAILRAGPESASEARDRGVRSREPAASQTPLRDRP
eukprot:11409062-Alexandrium_andersonii.AAC.1